MKPLKTFSTILSLKIEKKKKNQHDKGGREREREMCNES